ncbi:hypothetical protein P152DRAFT_478690 [Eremomyces bilateralis CBS 781.70]|uniref:Nuclear distribution protein RO10 n=1 Tax=Eremomyces bilateralis CBS 781.70 TaxID=1392243 RepID=A0A6G1GE20_9PEZI|nr:uncharacterized protein P152DRAFT_478690 [Eremomyces bilateralis CBS 781.70]KAF1816109.1 hypothetical protein P152DRAFT_478690 [Eremomyces bilateralis CBS 781.70]
MEPSLEDIAIHTLTSLESRLRRLEFLLYGSIPSPDSTSDDAPSPPQSTISRRLKKLEEGTQKLHSSHPDIVKIIWLKSRFPDLFSPSPTSETTIPPLPSQLTTLLSHAPLIHTTRSSLHSLHSLLPLLSSTSPLTHLLAASPQLSATQTTLIDQAAQVAELRRESAEVVWRWQEAFVIAQGGCWAEWEERVGGVEGWVRRGEREREEEG